jgi:hypothetical protein
MEIKIKKNGFMRIKFRIRASNEDGSILGVIAIAKSVFFESLILRV